VTVATVFVIGGHAFQLDDVTPDDAAGLIGLTSHAWAAGERVGHIELHPKAGVSLRLSLADIVAVEIDTTR